MPGFEEVRSLATGGGVDGMEQSYARYSALTLPSSTATLEANRGRPRRPRFNMSQHVSTRPPPAAPLTSGRPPRRFLAFAVRGCVFLGFWFVLIGVPTLRNGLGDFAQRIAPDLVVGLIASIMAAWMSVTILPPRSRAQAPIAFARLAERWLSQSACAGIDVARRAFSPAISLQPGQISFPSRLSDPTDRAIFTAMTSLVPGTLPIVGNSGNREGTILYHCLDTSAPVVASLTKDEVLLTAALGVESPEDRAA